MVPNPAKKPAYQQVEKARRALHSAETTRDHELLAASCPPPGASTVLTNAMIDTINADAHAAATEIHRAIPTRLPLAQVHPDQQVLDTETKLIHHAIRISAFNTAQPLARAILTDTGYGLSISTVDSSSLHLRRSSRSSRFSSLTRPPPHQHRSQPGAPTCAVSLRSSPTCPRSP
jgi:hypothetical protein